MKKLLSILFILSTILLHAQDFQWSIRGGGKNNQQRPGDYNNILAIEHDANDNVYILGKTSVGFAEVDGNPLTTFGDPSFSGTGPNVLLSSFTKEGVYRWSKVIGSQGGGAGYGLKILNGHVYISGQNLPLDSAYYDSDTTYYEAFIGQWRKQFFLIQYDTLGNYKWLRMPQTDTIMRPNDPELFYSIDAGYNGNIYWLCWVEPGAFTENGVSPIIQRGIHVAEYNPQGQVVSTIRLDMNQGADVTLLGFSYNTGGFKRDPRTGEFYVGGTCYYNDQFNPKRSLTVGGDTVKSGMYLAKFSPTGQVIWLNQGDTTTLSGGVHDIDLDGNGNIYLTGYGEAGTVAFNGVTFTSPETTSGPFLMKLKPNGSTVFSSFAVNDNVNSAYQIIVNGAEVAIAGFHGGLYFQGANDNDTLKAVGNQGYDMYIARFDTATGDLIQLKAAETKFGAASYGYSIGADSEGAYYIGGNYNGQLYLGNDTLFPLGSQRTFFLTKYACTPLQATFAVQADTLDGAFTFSGTANQAIDSIVWDFDNGHQLTGDSVGYQYFTVGTYIVCGTAYTGCGDSTFCDTLFVNKVGLEENSLLSFSLSPNPASETVKLHLPYATSKKLQLNITGINGQALKQEQLNEGVKQHEISLDGFAPGIYLLLLYDEKQVLVGKEKMMVR